eukprot:1922612-Prymnesium_polylepis.1
MADAEVQQHVKPPRRSLYWMHPGETEPAVGEEVYERSTVVVLTRAESQRYESHLKCVSETVHAKGFDDAFAWHETGWTKEALLRNGFRYAAEPTVMVVQTHADRFQVQYVYLPDVGDQLAAMRALCEYTFDSDGGIKIRGSIKGCHRVVERGKKGMGGAMLVFGTHNFVLGKGHKGTPSFPGIYNPAGREDRALNAL